jgi:Metallo-beta-lactamase superfamily
MLEPSSNIDIHDLNLELSEGAPRLLEMHQAGCGDLLRIRAPQGAIIIDAGPADCAQKLLDLLREQPCSLLVLTHLDADHFGGLHALVRDFLNGRLSESVPWPQCIWVNEFEPRDAMGAVLGCIGGAPETISEADASFSHLLTAAEAWRETVDPEVRSMHGLDVSPDTEIVIDADPASFRYLSEITPTLWLARVNTTVNVLQTLRDLILEVEELPLLDKLHSLVRDIGAGIEQATADVRAIGATPLVFDDVIVYDDRTLLVRAKERFRIHCRDSETRELIATGAIPPQVPHDIRAILQFVRNGPRLLESVAESSKVLPLVEALRRLPDVTVTGAKVGDDTSRFAPIAQIDILGPDDRELHVLARAWDRVRRKGQIHLDRRNDAFLEVTLFRALVPRYAPDPSPTNRSSIQMRVFGGRGAVVLTGDGRPEPLWRTLKTMEPRGPCRRSNQNRFG